MPLLNYPYDILLAYVLTDFSPKTGTGEQEAAEVEKAEEAIAQANQSLKD